MDKYKEEFLEKLSLTPYETYRLFATNYNEEKFNLISKIINAPISDFTETEINLINTKYRYSTDVAEAIILSRKIEDHFKDRVVEDFISHNLTEEEFGFYNYFVDMIFLNHPNISTALIEKMFNNYFIECMKNFKANKTTPQYSPKIINTLAKLYFDATIDLIPKPVFFNNIQPVILAHCTDKEVIDYVIKNLSPSCKNEAKITTCLLNNPSISDEDKEKLYLQHDYIPKMIYASSPNLVEQLYNSATTTMYEMNFTPAMSDYQNAFEILDVLLKNNLLSESQQIDLFNREIFNITKSSGKTTARSEVIKRLTETTQSPLVLHTIFEKGPHVQDRDYACSNLNISKNDLQTQADIYCKKIQNKINKGKQNTIPNRWFEELALVFKKIQTKDINYQMALSFQNSLVFSALHSSRFTPSNIIDEMVNISWKKHKENHHFRNEYIYCFARQKLAQIKCLDEPSITFFPLFLVDAIHSYRNGYDCFASDITAIIRCCDKKVLENTFSAFEELLNKICITSPQKEKDSFLTKVKNIIEEKIFEHTASTPSEFNKLTHSQLSNQAEQYLHDFKQLIVEKSIDRFLLFNDFVKRYSEIMTELDKKSTEINSPSHSL